MRVDLVSSVGLKRAALLSGSVYGVEAWHHETTGHQDTGLDIALLQPHSPHITTEASRVRLQQPRCSPYLHYEIAVIVNGLRISPFNINLQP